MRPSVSRSRAAANKLALQSSAALVTVEDAKSNSSSSARGGLHKVLALERECQLGSCSLQLSETLCRESWLEIGRLISSLRTSTIWWIGDWWAFGEHQYGERLDAVEAEDWEGPSAQTCMNAAAVCRAFQTYRRREALTFTHHAEVVSLDPVDADALLDWAEETIATEGRPRSVRAVRAEKHIRHDKKKLAEGQGPTRYCRRLPVPAVTSKPNVPMEGSPNTVTVLVHTTQFFPVAPLPPVTSKPFFPTEGPTGSPAVITLPGEHSKGSVQSLDPAEDVGSKAVAKILRVVEGFLYNAALPRELSQQLVEVRNFLIKIRDPHGSHHLQ